MNAIGRLFALPDFLRVIKAGEEVINPETWKNRQSLANALAVLLVSAAAIARSYGYAIPLSDDQIVQFVGLLTLLVFNIWATFATSRRVGLPSKSGDAPAVGTDGSGYRDAAQQPDRLDNGITNADLPVLTEEYLEREALNWRNPKG